MIDVESERTADVKSHGDFSTLMISTVVLNNMKKHGFLKPSPVQRRSIPTALSGLGSFFKLFCSRLSWIALYELT